MGLFDVKSKAEEYSAPWAAAQDELIYLTNALVNPAMRRPLEYFPGQTYAGQTEAEQQAIEQLKAGAGAYGGMMGDIFDPATQAYQSALMGPESVMGMGLQDVGSNPYLAGAAEAIQSRVNRNLQENILPGLTRAGVAGGGLGGTGQGVAEGIAARGTSDVLAEQLAGLYGGAWQAGLGAETSRYNQAQAGRATAMGMAPSMLSTALSGYTQPAAMLGQAGRLERAEDQRAIDEEMARFEFEQMEPWQRAQLGFETLMPAASAFGSRVGRERARPSTFSQIGQGLALGGAIGGVIGDYFGGGLGGPGAAGGFGLGAPGYGMGYGISPGGQQAQMLANQWGGGPWMWG